jgi:hypothetical protein
LVQLFPVCSNAYNQHFFRNHIIDEIKGIMTMTSDETAPLSGSLQWSHDELSVESGDFVHNDFSGSGVVAAYRFTPPAPDGFVFDVASRSRRTPISVTFASGGLAAPQTSVFDLVAGSNRAVRLGEPLQTLEFNLFDAAITGTSAGTIRGSLLFPGEANPRALFGVMLQGENRAVGLFNGPLGNKRLTGSFIMTPAEQVE